MDGRMVLAFCAGASLVALVVLVAAWQLPRPHPLRVVGDEDARG